MGNTNSDISGRWAPSVVLIGATIFACGYFIIATLELTRSESYERQHLVEVTNAFTQAFSENRGSTDIVPATFRRIGMDHFSENAHTKVDRYGVQATMRMPGTPGLELNTVEKDGRLKQMVADIASSKNSELVNEHRFEGGRFIGRTILPSVANGAECVNCHNEELGQNLYQVGDIMGAFVVETDLTMVTQRNLIYAFGAFFFCVILGVVMGRRERRRMFHIVKALREKVKMEQKQRAAEAYASFLASHDALTSLSNRKMFHDRLNSLAADAGSSEQTDVLVALIDLDDFKSVNDTMGHDAGDGLLSGVARRLDDIAKTAGGLAARLGGDEFALVVTCPRDADGAANLGQQIAEAMIPAIIHEGLEILPSVSIGIALMSAVAKADSSNVLKAADMALYGAKAAGKRQYKVFDAQLRETLGRRTALTAALPAAIETGGIRAVLQPQVDLKTGGVYGFEALTRWHWQGEEVPPSEFVPLAEECGAIKKLDLETLTRAAEFAVKASQEVGEPIRVSSNISPLDFVDSFLAEHILDALMSAGLSAEQLTVEVTESALMEDVRRVRRTLDVLRDAHVKIALDDFGTGYSSLAYLTSFPFDTIKIDRTFILGLETNTYTHVLLARLIDLAGDLNKTVIVEGIETVEQETLLKGMGAEFAQGYLYAKPLEVADALDFLRESMTGHGATQEKSGTR